MSNLEERLLSLKHYHKSLYQDDAVVRSIDGITMDVKELVEAAREGLMTLLDEYPPCCFDDYPSIRKLQDVLFKIEVEIE